MRVMAASFAPATLLGHAVLRCAGELDLISRLELTSRLLDLAETPSPRVVVDLGQVTFMDCGSVTILEEFARRLAPERTTYAVAPPGKVQRLLSAVDLDPVVRVRPWLDDALLQAG